MFEWNETTLTVKPAGRSDAASSPAVEAELRQRPSGLSRVVVDSEQLKCVSSAGPGQFLATEQYLEKHSIEMKLNQVKEHIPEVSDLVGSMDVVTAESPARAMDAKNNMKNNMKEDITMKQITMEASVQNIPKIIEFMDNAMDEWNTNVKAKYRIDVAADEILVNISDYAYGSSRGEVTVQLNLNEATRMLSIVFIDAGMPFDPLQKPDPDVTLPKKERKIGGLGIFIVKKIMDAVDYRREDGRNILTLQKRI